VHVVFVAATLLTASAAAAAVPSDGRPTAPPGAAAPALRDLQLDALDAALGERWGRLFAVAGVMLERRPLDGDAYRLAGDAALLGGRPDEARRLLAKAQLIAPQDGTARLLATLALPHGPPAASEPSTEAPPLRALAWLDLGGNGWLAIRRFRCTAAARALVSAPGEEKALALRAELACPEEPGASTPTPTPTGAQRH